MSAEENIQKLLAGLEDNNLDVRNAARRGLADLGQQAVPALTHQLKTGSDRNRWEVIKILEGIHDKAATEALVEALLDENLNVHWAATEALIVKGQEAILPLLEGITHHFESVRFRQGAFHILHMLERFHPLALEVQEVLDALRSIEPSVSAPWAAERAIEKMEFQN
jgi:HEAT repeat protein